MTDRVDRLLRETVHDLAVDADVISERDRSRLAVHAIDRAHTLRGRRRGAVVAVVILVTALAVGVPYGLRYLGSRLDPDPASVALPGGVVQVPGVPTHVIDDTSTAVELVDGWYVVGNRMVLDRTTNTYVPFHGATVVPSPDGRWVATGDPATGPFQLYDLQRPDHPRYEVIGGNSYEIGPQWSPDGGTLTSSWSDGIFAPSESSPPLTTMRYIDATSGEETRANVDLTYLSCTVCMVFWMPSGTELGMILDLPTNVILGIQIVGPDGQPLRTLPVKGYPAGPGSWSPDGRYVVVTTRLMRSNGPDITNDASIVDVETGEVVRTLDDLDVTQVQWIDEHTFLVWQRTPAGEDEPQPFRGMASLWTIDGQLLERWILPTTLVELDQMPLTAPLVVRLG